MCLERHDLLVDYRDDLPFPFSGLSRSDLLLRALAATFLHPLFEPFLESFASRFLREPLWYDQPY